MKSFWFHYIWIQCTNCGKTIEILCCFYCMNFRLRNSTCFEQPDRLRNIQIIREYLRTDVSFCPWAIRKNSNRMILKELFKYFLMILSIFFLILSIFIVHYDHTVPKITKTTEKENKLTISNQYFWPVKHPWKDKV